MSAYIKFATPMLDQNCLIAALADMGFTEDQVEVQAAPVALVGYQGDARAQKAEIVIRREHVGAASNDIGFRKMPTGYVAVISEFDRQQYGPGWLKLLQEKYQERERRKMAELAEARQAAEEAERVRAELERRRIEEERRRLVEAQRQIVTQKAKKLGYAVQEKREADVLRLVLVKRVF